MRYVIITMDGGQDAAWREAARLFERNHGIGVQLSLYSNPKLSSDDDWQRFEQDVMRADFIYGSMIFGEEHVRPMARALAKTQAPTLFITSNPALIHMTRLGKLSLAAPDPNEKQGFFAGLMQKLRPKKGSSEGKRQTDLLRNMTKIMKFIPGKARDLHTFIVSHDYLVHSTPENMERFLCLLTERYVPGYSGKLPIQEPVAYPDLAIYHPDAPGPFADMESYQQWRKAQGKPVTGGAGKWKGSVGLLTMRAIILSGNTAHLDELIRSIEAQGIEARTVYSAMLDFRPAIDAFLKFDPALKKTLPAVDLLINCMAFPLVGGMAGSRPDQAREVLEGVDVGYLEMIPLAYQRVEDWRADESGLMPIQVAMNIALPELDGSAEPVIFGGPTATQDKFLPAAPEIALAAKRIARRVQLHRKQNAEKKIAVVLFNFPPNMGNAGTAMYLDVFVSLHRLLVELRDQGYDVEVPADAETLRKRIVEGNAMRYGTTGNVGAQLPVTAYRKLFPHYPEIEELWGYAPGELLNDGRNFHILGDYFGKVFVAVQPSFGYEGDPMRLLMGKGASPHHGFAAFYTWLDHVYAADAVLHFGTHGALEFMPGKQNGLGAECWPHRLLGSLPNFYYYSVNNPSEGSIAKRRGAATLISYMVPPLQQAGLYKGLRLLKDSIEGYKKKASPQLLEDIQAQAGKLGIVIEAHANGRSAADNYIATLGHELIQVEHRMIPLGLHVLGKTPSQAEMVDILALVATFNPATHPKTGEKMPALPVLIARGLGLDYAQLQQEMKHDSAAQESWENIEAVLHKAIGLFVDAPRQPHLSTEDVDAYLQDVARIPKGLLANQWAALDDLLSRIVAEEEIHGLIHALDGGYIQPSPGNDIVRNDAVVPTGRNIHALDPMRVPSAVAVDNAQKLVASMLARLSAEQGVLPETVAMVLWGTDNLKSDCEGVAQVLVLLGARVIEDELGNISDVALIPLAELGRPRVDVVMTVSGIFRDLFHHQMNLLDKAVRLAAEADEPVDMNFVRKHTQAHASELGISISDAATRVFSNAPGAYGANVNHLVESSNWENDDELSDMFMTRKSFAYSRKGGWTNQRAIMERSLSTVDAAFQNIDSFEIGISDVDHYYEYLGGVAKSVEKLSGKRPPVLVAEAIAINDRIASLEQMVRLETRSKLLNPKWYESMLVHGYEGVREIEHRISNTYGWSATTDSVEGWVYNDIAGTFVLDEEMRERMAKANPHATAAIARRLLEADSRGFWDADDEMIEQLKEIYVDLEDRLEGIVTA
ncbi:magnesium chelatase subunit H [bacterium]|nr:magnesium chelatase subunit H [bacterium]